MIFYTFSLVIRSPVIDAAQAGAISNFFDVPRQVCDKDDAGHTRYIRTVFS